jgi:hypothetical protein
MRLLALLLLLASTVPAESVIAFQDRTFVSPQGAHRLEVRADKAFELRTGARGKVVASGKLVQLPADVHVFDRRPGAVLFERYGEIGRGDTLALLGRDGKLAWRTPLSALFDEKTIRGFPASMSSIWWHRVWWVDEARGTVVVVAKGDLVREVALAGGAVREAGGDAIVAGLPRPQALEVAADLKLAGARPAAEALVADPAQPLGVRLRAAVLVHRVGGARPARGLFEAALDPKRSPAERTYAIEQVPEALGADAIDLVAAAVRRGETAFPALKALARMGTAGAQALAVAAADKAVGAGVRRHAQQVFSTLPKDRTGRAIAKGLEGADPQTAGALLQAGIRAKVPDLHGIAAPHSSLLIRVLDRNVAPVDWLAEHFAGFPTTEAVPALKKALRRNLSRRLTAARIVAALKACTGQDRGNDPRRWLR